MSHHHFHFHRQAFEHEHEQAQDQKQKRNAEAENLSQKGENSSPTQTNSTSVYKDEIPYIQDGEKVTNYSGSTKHSEDKDKDKMRSKSFADLAEVLGFGNGYGRPSSRNGILENRPSLYSSLTRRSSRTKHRQNHKHSIPTCIIIRILSFCDDTILSSCLTVSRLFFNLSGTFLYSHLIFESSVDMWKAFKGSTISYENQTGKIPVGKRRFKDRLLRHTKQVTLHSHGDDDDDDDDDEDENNSRMGGDHDGAQKEEDYFGNFKQLNLLSHSRNSSVNTIKTTPNPATPINTPTPNLDTCPPISLNAIMPKLDTLRIILTDAFDYHLLFCPRYGTPCPLLEGGLKLNKLVVVGARSPLVVLPVAFPSHQISGPVNSSKLTSPLLSPPSSYTSGHSHVYNHKFNTSTSSTSSTTPTTQKSTNGLPIGLQELVIILPSGRSYDAKDYEGYQHVFYHRENLNRIEKLSIVFLTSSSPSSGSVGPRNKRPSPWQIAFYDSRPASSSYWTSYLCLAEDITIAILAIPKEANIDIVGIENIDGELLNMGIGVMKDGRVGKVMEERLRRQMEIRLKAKGRDNEIEIRTKNLNIRTLKDWLIDDGKEDLGEEGLRELGKEGWKEYR
ncbi:uncharacterized protein IL334_001744 [Kwoniella shivajii]|uniref:F-box domain-containing protein n=1 Tax=Kwoniella shivajii TaxID=564305 RepID=A0ABZ1CSR9_9TREE|nr:hypothetical protein IL334_001744 [Kwoniella shivajii]